MSTVDNLPKNTMLEGADWKISSAALDLLQCFMSGLDDVIVRIALEKARERTSPGEVTRVDAGDIEEASNIVLDQIRSQSTLPIEIQTDLKEMDECLRAKCQVLKGGRR